tara:strand:- start:2784 stop:2921 length:138 start_codon:yes stop_codon:yes gene_type:complete
LVIAQLIDGRLAIATARVAMQDMKKSRVVISTDGELMNIQVLSAK